MATATDTADAVSHDEAVRLSKAMHSGSFLSRLTTGTGAFDVIGRRRYYYAFSSVLVLISLLFIVFRGFHLGTDFAGGTTLTFTPTATSSASISSTTEVLDKALGAGNLVTVQTLGGKTIQATTKALTESQVAAGKSALTQAFSLPKGAVSGSDVSSTWGAQISERAILAVVVFLIAVGLFIWIRYEKRVAAGALLSVVHDVVVTAGIYSIAGFEVTPATVIGMLTILGFSLYDTVVVYDKVQENAKGLTSLLRRTYPETANLAVNQTLMRSLNTSLIALLPVAGLLVAGVAVLGGGTLKDLALVLLVGMLVGAYSSIFVAVPISVDLKLREPIIMAHTARVFAKRKHDGIIVDADGDPVGLKTATGTERVRVRVPTVAPPSVSRLKAGAPPKPGVKPQRPGRPTSTRVSARLPAPGGTGSTKVTKTTPLTSGPASPAAPPVKAVEPNGSVGSVGSVGSAGEPQIPAADAPDQVEAGRPGALQPPAATPVGRSVPKPAGSAAKPGGKARSAGKATRPTGKRGR